MRPAHPEGTVRPAHREDAGAIAAVHVTSWRTAYRGLLPDHYLDSLSVEEQDRRWSAVLTDLSAGHVLVVERGGSLVGISHAGTSRDADDPPATGEVFTLYLAPDVWGLGLGRDLLAATLDRLSADGHRSATLWMLSTNDRARRFYLRQGWSPTGRRQTREFGGLLVTDHRFGRVLAEPSVPVEPE